MNWRKSSWSGFNGNCVEWRKASASYANECVEVNERCQIRDSKNPGPVLEVSPGAWRALLADIKNGRYDL